MMFYAFLILQFTIFYQYFIMQGTNISFFPTRVQDNQTNVKKKHIYRLMKQISTSTYSKTYKTLEPNQTSHNIFQQPNFYNQPSKNGNQSETKTQGLVNKIQEQMNRRRKVSTIQNQVKRRKISLSNYNRAQNPNLSYNNNNNKRQLKTSQEQYGKDYSNKVFEIGKMKMKTQFQDQLYKSHSKYDTIQPLSKVFQTNTFAREQKTQSQQIFKQSPEKQQLKTGNMTRLNRQIQQNFDKKALLGQIDRVRPLVQLCGDKYFQMILRNRFEQEVLMPKFIYQIKDKFTDNKIISKLKKYKPDIMERQRLLLKGTKKFY